jgi:hypothetical protein
MFPALLFFKLCLIPNNSAGKSINSANAKQNRITIFESIIKDATTKTMIRKFLVRERITNLE